MGVLHCIFRMMRGLFDMIEQLVLFPTALEEVVPADHLVRVVDEILRSLDGTKFEAAYHGTLGARPIPPRVLAAVIL